MRCGAAQRLGVTQYGERQEVDQIQPASNASLTGALHSVVRHYNQVFAQNLCAGSICHFEHRGGLTWRCGRSSSMFAQGLARSPGLLRLLMAVAVEPCLA